MRVQRKMALPGSIVLVSGLLVTGLIAGPKQVMGQRAVAAHVEHDDTRAAAELLKRPITVVLNNVLLSQAIDSIARLIRAPIQYWASTLDAYPNRVSLQATALPLGIVLEHVLAGTQLRVVPNVQGDLTIVTASSARVDSVPQVGTVSGRVVDSTSGIGLNGATVKVQGTKLSVLTGETGVFTLPHVPVGDQVMTVRLFGHRPMTQMVTVVANSVATMRVMMMSVPNVLSGVVTTATGVQRKVEVGNDITVLRADSIQAIAPVTNLTQMLETRVPGLIVEHTSGIPGAPSRLRLRGVSSINSSNDPILIVDGIRVYAGQSGSVQPNNYGQNGSATSTLSGGGNTVGGGSMVGQFAGPSALDQIDPNSIETIEVLKGPSATSIYGSDAANGVIVITTNHGRVGPTRWNMELTNAYTTLPGSWPTNFFRFGHEGTGPAQFCSAYQTAPGGSCILDSIVSFQALNDSRYSPLTGQPGQSREASLTVSGGSGTVTYAVTGTASTQSGYLHLPSIEVQRFAAFHGFPAPGWMRTPDQYTTYGANSLLTFGLGQTGGTLSLSSNLFRSAQQQSSLQSDLNNLSAMYVDTTQFTENPLFPDYYTRAQLNTTTFTNALSVSNYSPWRWLPLTASVGVSTRDLNNSTLLPRDYITCAGNPSDVRGCATDSLGMYEISQGTNTTITLNGSTTLGRTRLVSTVVGLNGYTQSQIGYSAATEGLPIGVDVPTSFAYSDGNGPVYSTVNTATYGWFVEPRFNFHSRFFASPGFRFDGGSASGTHGGVGGGALSLFPKLDVSWIAVERSPSNPLLGALTLLRPRLAFGIAGVQPAPAEQLRLLQLAQVGPPTMNGASTPVDVLLLQTLGNSQLHPERDRELEGGVDAEFWNQRLSLKLTGDHKMAYDAILAIPVAPSINAPGGSLSGEQSYTVDRNIGSILNTGFEAELGARLLDSRRVDWSVNAGLTENHNRLVSLAKGQPSIDVASGSSAVTARLVPGFPIFGLWAPPLLSFADVNHDGLIESGEVRLGDSAVFLGAQDPNYELSLSTTLGFFNNRLLINTAADYQNGLTQTNSGLAINNATGESPYELLLNNPTTTLAQQAAFAVSLDPRGSSALVQTVSTLRWSTLAATYRFSTQTAHHFGVNAMSISLQGSNLALHTNYRGKDPNVNAFNSGNETVATGNELPQPRVWQLRLTLN